MSSFPQVMASPFSWQETQQRILAQQNSCAFSFGKAQRYSACALTPPTFSYRDGLASFAERQQISDLRSLLENFFSSWKTPQLADPYLGFARGKYCFLNFEALLELAGKASPVHQSSVPQCYGIAAEQVILLDHQEKQARLVAADGRGLHALEEQLQRAELQQHQPTQHFEMKRQPSYQELLQTLAPLSNTGTYTFVQRSSMAADKSNAWQEMVSKTALANHAVFHSAHHAVCAQVTHNIFTAHTNQLTSSITLPNAHLASNAALQHWEWKLAEHRQILQELTGCTWTEQKTLRNNTLSNHFQCHAPRNSAPVAMLQALCASPFFLPSTRELHALSQCEKHERRSCGGATVLWDGQHLSVSSLGEAWEYHDQQLSHFEKLPIDTAENGEQRTVSFW